MLERHRPRRRAGGDLARPAPAEPGPALGRHRAQRASDIRGRPAQARRPARGRCCGWPGSARTRARTWPSGPAGRPGCRCVLAGKCNEPAERRYSSRSSSRCSTTDVTVRAQRRTARRRCGLLVDARCLIMPIQWEEPFGMVMLEAMATGTPVVALQPGRGAGAGPAGADRAGLRPVRGAARGAARGGPDSTRRTAWRTSRRTSRSSGWRAATRRSIGASPLGRHGRPRTGPGAGALTQPVSPGQAPVAPSSAMAASSRRGVRRADAALTEADGDLRAQPGHRRRQLFAAGADRHWSGCAARCAGRGPRRRGSRRRSARRRSTRRPGSRPRSGCPGSRWARRWSASSTVPRSAGST